VTPLPIRVLGDPILRKETTPVTSITNDLRQLIDAMFTTMYAARGIGLAAPQVGRTERLTIVDVTDEPLVLGQLAVEKQRVGPVEGRLG